jgi:histone deacetylase 1/2
MSIMTNRYIDVDVGKSVPRRRFFKSTAKWDDTYGRVRLEKESVLDAGRRAGGLAALMEAGRSRHARDTTHDEDWEDGASV